MPIGKNEQIGVHREKTLLINRMMKSAYFEITSKMYVTVIEKSSLSKRAIGLTEVIGERINPVLNESIAFDTCHKVQTSEKVHKTT